jgi:diguanylate cyclase (GGDEF)-like protein
VERDEDARSAFRAAVSGFELVVDTVAEPSEALRLALENAYEVIVLDDRLVQGLERNLLRQLRALQHRTAFLVAHTEESPPASVLPHDTGVAGLIEKPFSPEELEAALDRAFALSRSRGTVVPVHAGGPESRSALLVGSRRSQECAKRLLEGWGALARIECVESLRDATVLLQKLKWSVVLTELNLPDAQGLDAVVRLHRTRPDVPVVVFSQTEDEALAVEAMHAGAQDFVVQGSTNSDALRRSLRFAMERQRAQYRIQHLALHDRLTNLANRELLCERLHATVARASRKDTCFAVLYLDLDRFKPINDSLGHDAGDWVLTEVSRRLQAEVREYDTVARVGGDEFVVLIDTLDTPFEAARVARRIIKAIAQPIVVEDRQLHVTCSIGVAVFPDEGRDGAALLNAADRAMYEAKKSGRNRFRFERQRSSESTVEAPVVGARRRASGSKRRSGARV